jgi:membrane protease YdiL (CAAX protease family)
MTTSQPDAAGEQTPGELRDPRLIRFEIAAVLAVSLGASAVSAVIDLIGDLTARGGLAAQKTTVLGSVTPGRPTLDLFYQLFDIASGLTPVLLVAYLLAREGASLRVIGCDTRDKTRDSVRGLVLAALIGGSGLALYLAAHALHLAATVEAANLPHVWWRYPISVLAAFQNGALEEIVVVGYLLRRLDALNWRTWQANLGSSLLRGSYHLYQGFGAFVGNAIMGLIFSHLYRRWGRVTPLVIAHGLIDTGAFVGYAILAGHHVSWLPT